MPTVHGMDAFATLSDPTRRRLLSCLQAGERSVGEMVAASAASQPVVSKHLKILRDAGFVNVRRDGQRRLYRINPTPLAELDTWLMPYRKFWSERFDALGNHLGNLEE